MENKLSAIIIEDEQLAREIIKNYLEKEEDIILSGEYPDGFTGLKGIHELKPDLVFLDIQMPKITGFEMLELLEYKPHIIFTTAYDQYAIKAFEMNAVDYLLKPFSRERFAEALDKVRNRVKNGMNSGEIIQTLTKNPVNATEFINRIVVKTGTKIKVIPVDDIRYFESQDDYVMIYYNSGKVLKQQRMKYYEEHLDPKAFVRIHRSYIVKIDQILQLELYEKDSYVVKLTSGEILKVSKTGLKALKDKLDF